MSLTTLWDASLRDRFAMAALPGVIEVCKSDIIPDGESCPVYFAKCAYEIADAMMEAREL